MSARGGRIGYVIALVLAVVTLIGSMLAAGLYVTSHRGWDASQGTGAQPWPPGPGQFGPGQSGPGQGGPGQGGMMGGRGDGRGRVMDGQRTSLTIEQATELATDWVAANQPGASLGAGVAMPMGWLFPLTRDGASIGSVLVYGSGQVAYRPDAYPWPSPSAAAGT